MEIDPRVSVIDERIKNIGKIILVSGFKGGIGKSLVSCGVALSLVEDMKRTGLLDLDITSSSCHKILGINELYPLEEKGILPVDVYGIKFMSFHFFSNNMPIALRGSSISDAIKEIFCIVQWGYLD
ncbi:MAG: P-loop NTPase, partial [Elusimicrobiales bacterium]|nr:P-loop NTPase [Elusimicrobiales bacterium]